MFSQGSSVLFDPSRGAQLSLQECLARGPTYAPAYFYQIVGYKKYTTLGPNFYFRNETAVPRRPLHLFIWFVAQLVANRELLRLSLSKRDLEWCEASKILVCFPLIGYCLSRDAHIGQELTHRRKYNYRGRASTNRTKSSKTKLQKTMQKHRKHQTTSTNHHKHQHVILYHIFSHKGIIAKGLMAKSLMAKGLMAKDLLLYYSFGRDDYCCLKALPKLVPQLVQESRVCSPNSPCKV